ncbi:flagellar hook-length control protein FliK [Alkalihalobacillus sp. 1P02AB]|uniref:flagellar hook-length control protein FliK n=1 Tax=Alkalihalobacillus sp. 1P02AB TaxID=3132260 RepID=UPI0039A4BBCE
MQNVVNVAPTNQNSMLQLLEKQGEKGTSSSFSELLNKTLQPTNQLVNSSEPLTVASQAFLDWLKEDPANEKELSFKQMIHIFSGNESIEQAVELEEQLSNWLLHIFPLTNELEVEQHRNGTFVNESELLLDFIELFPEEILIAFVQSNQEVNDKSPSLVQLVATFNQFQVKDWSMLENKVAQLLMENGPNERLERALTFIQQQVGQQVQQPTAKQEAIDVKQVLTYIKEHLLQIKQDSVTSSQPNTERPKDEQLALVQRLNQSHHTIVNTVQLTGGEATQDQKVADMPFAQTMSHAEQATIRFGVNQEPEVMQKQFLKQLEQIFQRQLLSSKTNGAANTIQVRLYPEHLGRLDIQIVQQEGSLVAKITAQTGSARELIESQINQLRQALQQQQLQVERIEVTEEKERFERENGQSSQQKEQEKEKPVFENEEDEASFYEWLESYSFDEQV